MQSIGRKRPRLAACLGRRGSRALSLSAIACIAACAAPLTHAANAAASPLNTSPPLIAGVAKQGSMLKAGRGTWTGAIPIAYTYRWQRCNASGEACTEIAGATTTSHKVLATDVSYRLRVVVTAKNSEGKASATSAATAVVLPLHPKKLTAPKVAGNVQDGQVLSASTGTWQSASPVSFSYQWQVCASGACSPISGATESTYRPVTSEIGQRLRVVVIASNAGGKSSAPSRATVAVVSGPPVSIVAPSATGTPLVGQTLTAGTGTWAGTPPFTYSYQWRSCNLLGECTDIAGATSSSYKVGLLDVANRLEVVVTASNAVGSASAASESTGLIPAVLPTNVSLPTVVGSLIDGQLLSVVSGVWSGSEPIELSHQWQLCNAAGEACKDISGAVGTAVSLISSYVGLTVRVVETATNSAGSVSVASSATSVVAALLPSNISLPSIAGSLVDGQLLSAVTGEWSGSAPLSFSYQWELCNSAGEACNDISGASESVLALVSGSVGSTVRVIVTATNSGGSTQATSAPTSLVKALLPNNVSLPSVSGLLDDGQTLAAAVGSWAGSTPISYSYQWQQCNAAGESCKNINEATGGTLGLVSGLVGSTIRVVVTATNSGGSTQATSAATSLIAALLPSNTSLPSISGLFKDGQTLAAAVGEWSGTTPISYSYQWQKCNAKGESCENVNEATGGTLGLISGLVGSTVRVVVTATNAGGSTEATSAASGVIAALLPSNTLLPSISGIVEDGQALTATSGNWSGTTPISYGYQWQQCNASGESCKNISEATGATLGLVSSLVGSTVRVVVTATNSGGSVQATSGVTNPILAILPKNLSLPSIAGLLADGQTLSAAAGNWSGTAPISYGYQWQQCNASGEACKNINEAVGSTLGLVSSLVGSTVRVVVTATNSRGSVQATSAASSLIAALLPSNTSAPTISGVLKDGQTLTAAIGKWEGTAPISYTYQWQKCNTKGEGCENISEATGGTLGLISSLVGSTVRVVVTATNSGGSTHAASTATGLIAALLPSNTSLPSVAGFAEDGQKLAGSNGGWSGTTPMTLSYQWQQCNGSGAECKNITKEGTGETLGVVSSLVKSTIRLVVTATNSGGSTQATSAATSPVLAALPINNVVPTISGALKLGEKLLAHHETWTGTAPISYTYQWQLCGALGLVGECKNITGATGENLLLELLDVGLTLRVGVTAHNERGASETAYSKVTGLIQGL